LLVSLGAGEYGMLAQAATLSTLGSWTGGPKKVPSASGNGVFAAGATPPLVD
jgi:hypothetical protein